MIKLTEEEFNEIWKPVDSVINYCKLEYDEAVTIGGQFGKLKSIILELQDTIESMKKDCDKLERLEMYGVDNWSGYSDAMSDSEGYFGEEE